VKKVKWLVIIITIVLTLSGVAYAGWTEQIKLDFNTKTGFTEFGVLDVRTDGLEVNVTAQNQVIINAEEIEEGEEASADIFFINTGTIPVDIDNIVISNVGGYLPQNKHDIYIDVRAYAGGNIIIDDSEKVSYWKSNGSVRCRSSLTEIPVGSTATVQVKVRFAGKNNGKAGEKEDKVQNEQKIFENVTFILNLEYSRFNED
jgi:hypothetical protein